MEKSDIIKGAVLWNGDNIEEVSNLLGTSLLARINKSLLIKSQDEEILAHNGDLLIRILDDVYISAKGEKSVQFELTEEQAQKLKELPEFSN